MKKLCILCSIVLLVLGSACKKLYDVTSKPGVSLPPVSNLALQKTGSSQVKLTWEIPKNIPDNIQQPLSVNIAVSEVINVMKTISVSSATLANAPTEYLFDLPNDTSTYHFTVKLLGTTKTADINYSSNIYSLGQTVVYEQ